MPVLKYRPDESSSWQTVGITADGYTKAETDTLLANKAPSGFGLGTTIPTVVVTTAAEVDMLSKTGWYYYNGGSTPLITDNLNTCYVAIRHEACGADYDVQYAYNLGGSVGYSGMYDFRRAKSKGTWQDWEYVNPPMSENTIYRTTERHLGKPVYKKMDSSGVIWWSTDQSTWKKEYVRTGAASYEAQQTIEKTTAPTRRVVLTASELQAYLDSLPRLLTDAYQITVNGTLDGNLNILGFYGGGYILITSGNSGFIINGRIYVTYCTIPIIFTNIQVNCPSGLSDTAASMTVDRSKFVRIDSSTFTGASKTEATAMAITDGGQLLCEGCSVSGFAHAVLTERSSIAIICGTANSFSNNARGAYVWHGGIIILYGVSDTLGGSANAKQGGIIVKSDGTLL